MIKYTCKYALISVYIITNNKEGFKPLMYQAWLNQATLGALSVSVHLTLKHRETHGCVVSTVATDALVLKHQAISILSTD